MNPASAGKACGKPAAVGKIVVIGSGCVGRVTAACLADIGLTVVAFDADRVRVARLAAGDDVAAAHRL